MANHPTVPYFVTFSTVEPNLKIPQRLAELGAIRVMESAWVVRSELSAQELAESLTISKPEDKLFVMGIDRLSWHCIAPNINTVNELLHGL